MHIHVEKAVEHATHNSTISDNKEIKKLQP